MKIVWTRKAEKQLDQIFEYINEDSAFYAYRTVQQIIETAEERLFLSDWRSEVHLSKVSPKQKEISFRYKWRIWKSLDWLNEHPSLRQLAEYSPQGEI